MHLTIFIGVYDENGQLVTQEQTWSVESYIAGVIARDMTPAAPEACLKTWLRTAIPPLIWDK